MPDPVTTSQGLSSLLTVGGPVVGFIVFVLAVMFLYAKFYLPAQERREAAERELRQRADQAWRDQINSALELQRDHNEQMEAKLEKLVEEFSEANQIAAEANKIAREALTELAARPRTA